MPRPRPRPTACKRAHPAAAHHRSSRRLLRTWVLGGLINEYGYAA
ncbi:hypothetical protein [Streptomyces sp. P9-A2]